MNKKSFDTEKLIQIIYSVLINTDKSIDYLNSTKITRTACIWNIICESFFGYYQFSRAMAINQRWKRNSDNIVFKLSQLISLVTVDNNSFINSDNRILNKLSFEVNETDWTYLEKISSSILIIQI